MKHLVCKKILVPILKYTGISTASNSGSATWYQPAEPAIPIKKCKKKK